LGSAVAVVLRMIDWSFIQILNGTGGVFALLLALSIEAGPDGSHFRRFAIPATPSDRRT